jgi:hypothetical protein
MGTVTVDLAAAGLTHAKGKSDKCGGTHEVDAQFVTRGDDDEWVSADRLVPLFQKLHEQAHPKGVLYWENCREQGCAEALALLSGED